MKITLGELKTLVNEALFESGDELSTTNSLNKRIDDLPSIELSYGSKNIDYVDINSIFEKSVIDAVFPVTKKQLRDFAIMTKIPASEIHPAQEFVIRDGLKRYVENPPSELPLVVKHKDGRYIAQDHTRIAAQIMKGASMIDVRLIEYTGSKYEPYRQPNG